ncbi:MAG TPA: cytochrome c biogenesis protein CcsA [Candidatus Kapabacteria bacterium]|nr:cytochrome c biogenesis protein CcsA [Candidatus Kapabacteria bacterium]
MSTWVSILQTALPFLYAALVYIFGQIFFRPGVAEARVRRVMPFAVATVIVHATYICLFTLHNGRCLLGSFPEISSLIAFTLFSIYTVIEVRRTEQASGTGFFVSLIAGLFQIFSSIVVTGEAGLAGMEILKDPVFNLHVTAAIFGYAAWTLATIYGGLYLLLYKAMKSNKYGAIFEHLPSLERLEKYGLRATGVGFGFLTLAIWFGWRLMSVDPELTFSSFLFHPKILATLLAWLVFGVTLMARRVIRLEGRKLVMLWMSGFVLTIISMGFINAFGMRV